MMGKGKRMMVLPLSVLLVCTPVCVYASSSSLHLYTEKDKTADTVKKSAAKNSTAKSRTGITSGTAAKTGDDSRTAGLLAVCLTAGCVIYLAARQKKSEQDLQKKE